MNTVLSNSRYSQVDHTDFFPENSKRRIPAIALHSLTKQMSMQFQVYRLYLGIKMLKYREALNAQNQLQLKVAVNVELELPLLPVFSKIDSIAFRRFVS